MGKLKYFTSASKDFSVSEREARNKEIAYNAALEGIVLLKNDGALPVKGLGNVALYGAGASMTIKGGTGSGEVNERHATTILEGMEKAGFTVTTKRWIADFEQEYADNKQAYNDRMKGVNLLKMKDVINMMSDPMLFPYGREITDEDVKESNTDTAIYVVSRQAGEGADKKLAKGEFDLSLIEIANIKKIASSYKNSVLVINSGSSMDLSVLDEVDVKAVIYFCQQGMEGGRAFADLILGKTSPSGKLTDTWVKKYIDIPFHDEYSYLSGDTTQEYYHEGIYVGYRYFDTYKVEPRYHFGFGLSYTTFTIKTTAAEIKDGNVTVKAEVENTGDRAGKEVVEVYVSAPDGQLKKEYQRLVGFKKTKELQPGEKQEIFVTFPVSYMASYCEKCAAYVLESGDYIVRVGNSSDNTEAGAVITLAEKAVVSKNKNICTPKERVEELVPVVRENEASLDNAIRLTLNASDVVTEVIEYKTPDIYHSEKVDEIMNKLSVKDMAEICVGAGIGGMMASTYLVTPGAVGRTTDKLYKKGLINVNLSDGPAGLRLQKRAGILKNGKIKMVDVMMDFMNNFPKFIKNIMCADPNKCELIYQYCTAFPVGTALAQSWNEELCENVGRAVSDEMTEFNITYWLAPAQNIHRNPLCGRNFEYLSEDPVLTGKISASITRGVQYIPGNYVTIKHYACNNQEDNRNRSNSNVNERALREIYLKGFEICVKEANAKSVMTSYNLINGTYAPNNYGTVTEALRNEWGFDGVVMTDWFSTGKGLGRNDIAIKVGNDMIMPGGGANKKEILKGVKEGTVSKEDLRRACANIVRSIVESDVATRITPDMFN